MKTTLENLTEKVQENRLRNLAKNIVQYQNFKTSVILKRIDNAGYSSLTLKSYITSGIIYIKRGVKNKQTGVKIYEYIDDAIKNCVQPLTPKQNEIRINYPNRTKNKAYKKDTVLPIQQVLNNLSKEISSKKNSYMYAIKLNNTLKIYNSLPEAQAFLDGLSILGKTEANIVKLTIESI